MKRCAVKSTPKGASWVMAIGCAVAGSSWADPVAQMRQCRLLTDVALKAACYDAIALPAPGSGVSAAPPPLAAPARAAATPVNPTATAAASFGLPAAAPVLPAAGTVVGGALESSIVGSFEGWQAQSRIRLANGQVWQITDGSEGVYSRRDPKVRISRGTLGSFFLQIDGVSQTPRVRRIE
jgi:hypothetical protein